MDFQQIWNNWQEKEKFSGVFCVTNKEGVAFECCQGFRNRGEELRNQPDTAFGIASGTKLFTGLAICKLIDEGKLLLKDKIGDVLPYNLEKINREITIGQLLTHTSGIGDYIDEEAADVMEKLQDLYNRYPVYMWERLEYYLKMITPLPAKFSPAERFSYSNAGFVLLGLVVEAVSGLPYQQFVQEKMIKILGLEHTGFYRTDSLPCNTALGYIEDKSNGWRSNIFSLPVIGGSDGGLYTCAGDLDKLWRKLFNFEVLSPNMLEQFLALQVKRNDSHSYGLGVYRYQKGDRPAFYAVGSDFGIDFFTVYFPELKTTATALGDCETNTYPLLKMMFDEF